MGLTHFRHARAVLHAGKVRYRQCFAVSEADPPAFSSFVYPDRLRAQQESAIQTIVDFVGVLGDPKRLRRERRGTDQTTTLKRRRHLSYDPNLLFQIQIRSYLT